MLRENRALQEATVHHRAWRDDLRAGLELDSTKTLLRSAVAATIIGLAGGLGGCASLITGGELIRPGEPTGGLQIRNVWRTNPIDVVLVSSYSACTFGLNCLPSGQSILPGGSYTFTVSAVCRDIGASEVLSQNTRTGGYAKVRVTLGRTTTVQSR